MMVSLSTAAFSLSISPSLHFSLCLQHALPPSQQPDIPVPWVETGASLGQVRCVLAM